jgi:hypothetical protein
VLALRTDTLPGAVVLEPAGTVRLALDLDTACRSIPFEHRVDTIEERARMSPVGIVSMVLGTAAVLGSFAGTGTVNGEYCTKYNGCMNGPHLAYTSGLAAAAAIVGGAMIAAPWLVQPRGQARRRVRDEIAPASVAAPELATVGVSCGDPRAALAAIGEIEMIAPWGDEVRARPGADGVARFAIDWTRAGDPSGQWQFVASRPDLQHTWTPTPDERLTMDALR